MSDRFRESFDLLISRALAAVVDLLERVEERIYEQEMWSLPVDATFEHVPPPQGILDDEVRTEADLEAAIQGVDLRWRLDAVMALTDYVD
jgi:hypothetical protein